MARNASLVENRAVKGITVIGYGSLMSAYGLNRDGDVRPSRPRRVALQNSRRGFAKPARQGNRLAMAVDAVDREQPITANVLEAQALGPPTQGLAFDIRTESFPLLSHREGYRSEAAHDLLNVSQGDVARYLFRVWNSATGVAEYRRILFETLGYTSPHYIPHPLQLDGERAVIFLAPEREGSGSDETVPVRLSSGPHLLTSEEAWRAKSNDSQLDYIAMCLLAAAHGIRIDDFHDTSSAQLQEKLAAYETHYGLEKEQFRDLFRLSDANYLAFAAVVTPARLIDVLRETTNFRKAP